MTYHFVKTLVYKISAKTLDSKYMPIFQLSIVTVCPVSLSRWRKSGKTKMIIILNLLLTVKAGSSRLPSPFSLSKGTTSFWSQVFTHYCIGSQSSGVWIYFVDLRQAIKVLIIVNCRWRSEKYCRGYNGASLWFDGRSMP